MRRFSWIGSIAYVENTAGRVETREHGAEFAIEFQNSDRFSVAYTGTYEFLPRPFEIASGVTLPVGGYDFDVIRVGWNLGQQRLVSANLLAEHGTFYSGTRTALSASRGRVTVGPQFALEPTYTVNWVDLEEGSFTTHLVGSRVTYTMTPRMFVELAAPVQFEPTTRSQRTCACGGSTGPAASCSSCTTTSGTRVRARFRRCRRARSS